MRSAILIALSAALALSVTTSASALSSINLTPLGSPTSCGADCYELEEGQVIRFAITVTVDTLGYTAHAFDIRWGVDLEDELTLSNFRVRGAFDLEIIPGTPPITLTFNTFPLNPTQESTNEAEGQLYAWDATASSVSPPFPATVSFRVGVVEFTATANVNGEPGDAANDIEIGFFRPSGPGFGDGEFNNITPTFTTLQIVPEPKTAMLIGASLSTLALLAMRRTRQDD